MWKNFTSQSKNIGVFVFLESKDGLVFVKKNYDDKRWYLPGGAIEKDEGILGALSREILEETGIRINSKLVKYIGIFYSKPGRSLAFLFKYKIDAIDKFSFNSNEILDVKVFGIDSIRSKVSNCTWQKIVFYKKYRNNKLNNYFQYNKNEDRSN